jgi:hypothetical protein
VQDFNNFVNSIRLVDILLYISGILKNVRTICSKFKEF